MAREASTSVWWRTFVAVAAVGAVVVTGWSLTVAPMGSPDEPSHVVKAAAVVRGETQTASVRGGGVFGQKVPRTFVRLPAGYTELDGQGCWLNRPDVPTACAEPLPSRDGATSETFTYVGGYQPTYYALVGWPSLALPPRSGLWAMRMASAAISVALVAAAAATLRTAGGRGATAVGVVAAATPTALLLAGTVNPNGTEVAAAIGLWAGLLALLDRRTAPEARLLVQLAVSAVVLVAVRPLSPALGAAVVLAAAAFALDRERLRTLLADRRVVVTGVVVAVATALSAAFVVVNGSASAVIEKTVEPESVRTLVGDGLADTGRHLEEAVAVLGWLGPGELTTPDPLWQGWLVLAVALAAVGLVVTTWRRRAVIVGVVLAALALPVVAQVLKPEVVWQGRYLLPVLVGVPILAGWEIDRSPWGERAASRVGAVALAVAFAGLGFLAHQVLLSRNVAGRGRGLFEGLSGGPWAGPVAPWALTVLVALGCAGTVALVARATVPVTPSVREVGSEG